MIGAGAFWPPPAPADFYIGLAGPSPLSPLASSPSSSSSWGSERHNLRSPAASLLGRQALQSPEGELEGHSAMSLNKAGPAADEHALALWRGVNARLPPRHSCARHSKKTRR